METNEERYNRLMNDLTELKEQKMQKNNEVLMRK